MSESFETAIPSKRNRSNPPAPDRLPPHDTNTEQAVIGCCLIAPDMSLALCEEQIQNGDEAFYDLRHQRIYSELLKMHVFGEKIDSVTLGVRLGPALAEVGGHEYLGQCEGCVLSPANLESYLEILSEKLVLRRILAACTRVASQVYEHSGKVDQLLDEMERDVLAVSAERHPKSTLDGKQSGKRMLSDLERRHELQGALSGLDTGLIDLNWKTEGLQFGEQAVIGARPSMGKTAFGLGVFRHNALKLKIPSLFVSLEMSVEALMRRMLAGEMNEGMRGLRKGSYNETQFSRFMIFNTMCSKSPMHFIDGISGMTCRELCSCVRKLVVKHGIKLVVVDYLQKIKADVQNEKRTYEVADTSQKLKALAVETNVALLTLAQLNRESVNQKGRPPRLSDFADSGQIERDADLAALIHRDKDGNPLLIIAKQRDGETGIVNLVFDGQFCRFENMARESDKD